MKTANLFSRLSTKELTSPSQSPSTQGCLNALEPSYTFISSGKETKQAVQELHRLSVCGLDIETTGLDPMLDEILLIQLGTDEHVFVFDVKGIGQEIKYLSKIISSPYIVKLGQNLGFEWTFLEANGLPLRGPLLDTLFAGQLLNLGLKYGNTLDELVARHLGKEMTEKKELQLSFVDHQGDFSKEQLMYAARDVSVCFPLYRVLIQKLRKAELTHIFRLECRALPAFASMKVNGFLLDVDYYKQLLAEQSVQRDKAKADVIDIFARAGVLSKYTNPETHKVMLEPEFHGKGKNKIKGFNIKSPKQLAPVLRALGVPVENSLDRKKVLAWLAPDYSIIREYLVFKDLDTACIQMEKLIGHAEEHSDHRIRANYRQLGTDTGRVSCAGPNLQNVKSGPEYRKGFIASPGCVLIIADYSQLELRIAAECSGDERMLSAYRDGIDFHTRTAALMNNIEEEQVTKEQRRSAKTYNFGALFGSGAKSMRVQAADAGLFMTIEEAQDKLSQWKSAFPQLIAWQRDQGNKTGPIFTLMGRRRLVNSHSDKYTARLNTQVQGTGGDCMKAALTLLWENHLLNRNQWKLVANVHDETVLEVPEEDKDEAQIVLKECMESAAYGVMIVDVPIVADAGYGNDWSAK